MSSLSPELILEVPATAAHVALARTAVGTAIATLGASVDDVADLALAVGEAAGLLLECAANDAILRIEVTSGSDEVTVRVGTACASPPPAGSESLAWIVLTALAPSVTIRTDGDLTWITTVHPLHIPV